MEKRNVAVAAAVALVLVVATGVGAQTAVGYYTRYRETSASNVPTPTTSDWQNTYIDSTNHLMYRKDSTGTVTPIGSGGSGGGSVTSVTASSPLTGGTITTSGSIGLGATGPGSGSYCGSSQYVNGETLDAYGRVTAVTCGTPPIGTGTVTSVGLTAPSILTVSGSPVTTSGTISLALANESALTVLAGPASGSAAPTFRALTNADLPAIGATASTYCTGSTVAQTVTTDSTGRVVGVTCMTPVTAVGGSLASGQVAYGNAANVVTSSPDLTFNPSSGLALTGGTNVIYGDSTNGLNLYGTVSGGGFVNLSSANATMGSAVGQTTLSGVSDGQTNWNLLSTGQITGKSGLADSSSAVAYILDTLYSYATSGDKLLSVRNAGTEKWSVDGSGNVVAAGSVTTPTVTSTASTMSVYTSGYASPSLTFTNYGSPYGAILLGQISNGDGLIGGGGSVGIRSASQNIVAFSYGSMNPSADLITTNGAVGSRWKETWSSRYAGVEQPVSGAASITLNPASGEAVQITLATCPTTVNGAAGDPNEEMTTYWRQPASGSTCTPSGFATGTNGFSFAGTAAFTPTLSKMDLYTWKWDATSNIWREKSRSLNLTQ